MPAKKKINPAYLEKEWQEGATAAELARKYDCDVSLIYKIRSKNALAVKMKNGNKEPPAPTPLDERMSQMSLMPSPWVRARIAEIKKIQ
jgi:hypothetical protein